MHRHQHIISDPFVWNHCSLFFYMRMFLISCVWKNLMKANLYCITISRQIPITRNTASTLNFCFVSEHKWAHIVLYIRNWYKGEHKIRGLNLYPLKMTIIIIMITQDSLWACSWWFASLLCLFIPYTIVSVMKVRETHLFFFVIFHYIASNNLLESPETWWSIRNCNPHFMYGVTTKACHNHFCSLIKSFGKCHQRSKRSCCYAFVFFAIKLS